MSRVDTKKCIYRIKVTVVNGLGFIRFVEIMYYNIAE